MTSFSKTICVMVFLLFSSHSMTLGQISEAEHLSHHPEKAKEESAEESKGEKKAGGMMGGGMMGGGMSGMMEKMGAPKERELYPDLMRLPDLPLEKRREVQDKAHLRMREGIQLISKGTEALTESVPTDNFGAMQEATLLLKEGISHFDSGLAAHRALAEGSEPRNVALRWFRKEMNLSAPATADLSQRGVFGISPFHFFSMTILIAFAALMLWMYFFKMRRAAQLLQQLSADAKPPSNLERDATPGNPLRTPSPQRLSAPSEKSAEPPSFPEMRSPSQPVESWVGSLRVDQILQETPDVKTFRLAATDSVALPFTYRPGQFLTFDIQVDGKATKRSYTIASSPTQLHYCAVTVKRESEGIVSKFLHDNVSEGDLLKLRAPSGKFTFTGKESKSIVLIGGGVGITPLMSAIRYLTDIGWKNEIFLLYCCRTTSDFIFRNELEQLQLLHPNLQVHASMTRDPGSVWMGLKGYFTPSIILHLVSELSSRRFHICGPPPMMDAMVASLTELGVNQEQIFTEAFGPAKKPSNQTQPTESASKVDLLFKKSDHLSQLDPGQTILEAAEDAGIEIDNSCRSGQCGLCKIKLLSGEVAMECEDSLSEGEKKEGIILACQATASYPVSVDA